MIFEKILNALVIVAKMLLGQKILKTPIDGKKRTY
jgi:hypothetical protein